MVLAHLLGWAMPERVFHIRFREATATPGWLGDLLSLPLQRLRWQPLCSAQRCTPTVAPVVLLWVWVPVPLQQRQRRQLSRPLRSTAVVAAQAAAVAVE